MMYHKIRNVEKSVCTAEQKIAYNCAFLIFEDSRYNWLGNKDKARSVLAYHETRAIAEHIERLAKSGCKYNLDAAQCALNAGLHDYIFGKYHILNNYEDIGKAFPANYLN